MILAALALACSLAPARGVDEVVVQIRDDDGAAGAALGEQVIANGSRESPPIRMETPPEGKSRLGAARERCAVAKPAIAVFWVDVARTDEWRLYALPCAAPTPLVREIPVGVGEEEASIETLWLIVQSSAAAIAVGAEPAMQAVDPAEVEASEPKVEPRPEPPPKPVAPTKPTPPRSPRWTLRLAYAGDSLAPQVPWQSGVLGGFAFAPRTWLRVGASYEFLAHARRDRPAGFALWRHGVAITASGVATLAKRVALEVRIGAELELSRWRSDAAGRGRLRAVPRFGADVLLSIALGRGVSLELGPGLAVAIIDVDFVTCAAAGSPCTGMDREVVVDARRVRPRARAGISVQF
ncbi:MAG TPA: hypothetical protein VG755_03010 [Nannocystaceae bacterium]|nr:hypothetical protein [Nannocystaceae bacterium]